MRIDSIRLVNYRCFRDRTVRFSGNFSALVGANGSGKTSLLMGICESFIGLFGFFPNAQSVPSLAGTDIARLEVLTREGRVRFEPQYPVEIQAVGQAFGEPCTWTVTKAQELQNGTISGNTPGMIFGGRSRNRNGSDPEVTLPIAAFYRASRSWNQAMPGELQAAVARNARMNGYAKWWDASLDGTALQTWAISKSLERAQISSETGKTFDSIDDDELALVNHALGAALEDTRAIRYDLVQKDLMIERATRPPTPFSNLSHGQRAVVGLVVDIARRMCLLNPHLGPEVMNKTAGIVLIDELDMHLHPQWQRIVTRSLKSAFPSVQFIIASHSPQVLSELRPEEIILLRPEGTDHPEVSYGLDSSRILEEIMGATARPENVEERLRLIFSMLERNELASAKRQIDWLEEHSPGLPELIRADALLKRKETVGR